MHAHQALSARAWPQLSAVQERVDAATGIIGPAGLRQRIDELERQTLQEGFWDAQGGAQAVMTQMAACKEDVATAAAWRGGVEDAQVALELAVDESGVRACASSYVNVATLLGGVWAELRC